MLVSCEKVLRKITQGNRVGTSVLNNKNYNSALKIYTFRKCGTVCVEEPTLASEKKYFLHMQSHAEN